MRVGFVCGEYPPGPHGGIGTLVQLLARALVAAGHEVRVAGVYSREYPAPDRETDRGVSVQRLRAHSGPFGSLRSRAALFRFFRRLTAAGELDVVEAPDWEGWTAGWPRLDSPVVTRLSCSSSFFESELGRSPRRLTFWIERAALRRADFVCAESRYIADRTREVFGLSSSPDAIIYNPVDATTVGAPVERKRDRVVFAGTLAEKKGIRSLVRAWPRVIGARPGAELHVFGKPGTTAAGRSMQAELEDELRASGAGGVVFRGHVPLADLLEELKAARVVVLPSYAEGFSLMPLHAMACGCPTIYSRRGSGPEVIVDGVDGLLVDPETPEEIASAILRVLTDDGLASRLGEAGALKVRRQFALQSVLRENILFYERCVAAFRRKRGVT